MQAATQRRALVMERALQTGKAKLAKAKAEEAAKLQESAAPAADGTQETGLATAPAPDVEIVTEPHKSKPAIVLGYA